MKVTRYMEKDGGLMEQKVFLPLSAQKDFIQVELKKKVN